MRVLLDADGRLSLIEADDFHGFSLRLVPPLQALPSALPPALDAEDDRHVWVDLAWLRAQLPPEAAPSLQPMLDYAGRKGWLRADPPRLRAHVET